MVKRFSAESIMWSLDGVEMTPTVDGGYVRHSDYATLEKSLVEIEELLCAGQGDDDGMQIMPDFEPGMSTAAKVEDCLHLLEKRRDTMEAQNARLAALEAENAQLRVLLRQEQDALDREIGTRTEASAAVKVDVSEILLPLEDIHSDAGQCEWADVANAIDEIRRRILSALSPAPQEVEAVGVMCLNCKSSWTDDRLAFEKEINPKILSCCPERKSVPVYTHPPAPAVTEALAEVRSLLIVEHADSGAIGGISYASDALPRMVAILDAALQAAQEVKP